MSKEYRVLIVVMPVPGHFNPMLAFVNELAKCENLKIFIPGKESDRKMIEKTRAVFVPMEVIPFDPSINMNEIRKTPPMDRLIRWMTQVADEAVPKLVKTVDDEKIDLIINDFATSYATFLREFLRKRESQGGRKAPECVMFCPSFMCAKDIYPNKAEPAFFPTKVSPVAVMKVMLLLCRLIRFGRTYNVNMFAGPEMFLHHREELNICGIMPELQPRAHLFGKSVVFVGSCFSEELRPSKSLEEPFRSFLEPFEPTNPVPLNNLKVDDQLLANRRIRFVVYASFGTLFNEDIKPFLDIIAAFQSIQQSEIGQLKLVVSTGDKTYAKLQEMIAKSEIKIAENILLASFVPQIEVIKRASVFITHSGQGSTNEAIHYGVPMICIPVFGDQPPVAYRVCDELGLGIRLDYDDLSSVKIKNALVELLTDESYLERVALYAQISRKYDGPKMAAETVIQYLQKLESKRKLE